MFTIPFNIKTSWKYNVGFNWDGHILITTYLQWMLLLFIDYQTLLYLPVAYSVLTWHPFFAIEYIFEPEILGYEFIDNNIKLVTYCIRWIQKFIMLILDMYEVWDLSGFLRLVNQKRWLLFTSYQHCHQRTLFLP